MARRGENIYKRKDGRWEGRYIKGRGFNGKDLMETFIADLVLQILSLYRKTSIK